MAVYGGAAEAYGRGKGMLHHSWPAVQASYRRRRKGAVVAVPALDAAGHSAGWQPGLGGAATGELCGLADGVCGEALRCVGRESRSTIRRRTGELWRQRARTAECCRGSASTAGGRGDCVSQHRVEGS
jgi:hypothetical protein